MCVCVGVCAGEAMLRLCVTVCTHVRPMVKMCSG